MRRLGRIRSAAWLALCMWLACTAHAATFPDGSGKLEVEVRGTKLDVFTYKPAGYKDGPLIVVFHGMLRNADTYRDNARSLGDRFGALIAAPHFDTNRFPNEAYQRGGVTKRGAAQPRDEWTFSLVPKLVDEVRRAAGRPEMPFQLIGHSAGGQFLVRMAAFTDTGAQRIVAANAGAHIFPTRDADFPYGFGKLPDELANDAALKRFLAQPLTLFQGTADVLGANLDKSAPAMRQGATRIERGRENFRRAQELAVAMGWPFNWSLVEAPDIGHDSAKMFGHTNAETAIFSAKCLTEPVSRKSLILKATESSDPFTTRPMLALWLEDEGRRVSKSPAPALRFAVWPDGRVVFTESTPKFGKRLQEGKISTEDVKKLRDAILRSDVFSIKRDAALVPDAPSMCLLADTGEKRRLLQWDERETPGYGINIAPSRDDRKFIATWKLLNQLGLGAKPEDFRPVDSKFTRPPASWYLREQ